jgi:hypothetical protein
LRNFTSDELICTRPGCSCRSWTRGGK